MLRNFLLLIKFSMKRKAHCKLRRFTREQNKNYFRKRLPRDNLPEFNRRREGTESGKSETPPRVARVECDGASFGAEETAEICRAHVSPFRSSENPAHFVTLLGRQNLYRSGLEREDVRAATSASATFLSRPKISWHSWGCSPETDESSLSLVLLKK